MHDKIIEFVSTIDETSYDEFVNNAKYDSDLNLDGSYINYDYSWLNQVEKYLPFISNIISTDFNTYDEDIQTSYEILFVRTLVYQLYNFLLKQQEMANKLNDKSKKTFTGHLKTNVGLENIELEIKIKTTKKQNEVKGEAYGLTLNERIQRVINITKNLLETPFIQKLEKEPFVSSPIEVTSIFEEEPNYRNALKLYDFILEYNKKQETNNALSVKEKFDEQWLVNAFFNYNLLQMSFKSVSEDNAYRLFLERLIEKMVLNSPWDEKNFKRMLSKKFEEEYNKKKKREKTIQNIFVKNIESYNKQIKDALRAIKN